MLPMGISPRRCSLITRPHRSTALQKMYFGSFAMLLSLWTCFSAPCALSAYPRRRRVNVSRTILNSALAHEPCTLTTTLIASSILSRQYFKAVAPPPAGSMRVQQLGVEAFLLHQRRRAVGRASAFAANAEQVDIVARQFGQVHQHRLRWIRARQSSSPAYISTPG